MSTWRSMRWKRKGSRGRLAEPNLVALSGETAKLPRRWRIPIRSQPQCRADPGDLQAIRRQPRVHPDGAQRQPDQPEDHTGGEPARPQPQRRDRGWHCRPGADGARATTTIELKDGQSFVLAGSLAERACRPRSQQLPVAGQRASVGTLFSSKSFQKNETDLVIIVTPHLVNPTRQVTWCVRRAKTRCRRTISTSLSRTRTRCWRTEVRGGAAQVERDRSGNARPAKRELHAELQ